MRLAQGALYLAFLLACGLGVGLGILAMARFPRDFLARLLLAPFAATLVWSLFGNIAVRLGLTMAQATPAIWALSGLLVIVGLVSTARHAWAHGERRRAGLLVGGFVGATAFVTGPLLTRGLVAHLGSPNLDTAFYTSIAAAYWRFGLDPGAHLPLFFERLLDAFAILAPGRNHTFVLLSLFSPLVEAGEPVFVRNLFVCWSVFTLAASVALYWVSVRSGDPADPWPTLAYVWVTLGTGWAVIPALVGNWDNALFASVGPVLAALAVRPAGGIVYPAALGVTGAYAIFTYPELLPVLGAILAPFYVLQVANAGSRRPDLLRSYAVAGVVVVATLAPGLRALWGYFWLQVQTQGVAPGMRPGGRFAYGLAEHPWDVSVWWGLGAEHGWFNRPWDLVLAGLLTVIAGIGVVRLARRPRSAEVWAVAVAVASLAYFVLVDRYAYGGYKVLSVSWWLFGRCFVEGAEDLLRWTGRADGRRWWPRAAYPATSVTLAVTMIGGLGLAERNRTRALLPEGVYREQPRLHALASLKEAAMREPPTDVLVVGRFHDWVLPWVFYTLRDTSLRLYHDAELAGGFPGGRAWPQEKGPLPEAILVPSRERPPRAAARFDTRAFALLDMSETPPLAYTDNPNGIESWGTWLGTEPITISVISPKAMTTILNFEAEPGPSRPGSMTRTLIVGNERGELTRVVVQDRQRVSVELDVSAGWTRFTLRCIEQPTVHILPNGDTRPLLVGIMNLSLRAGSSP